MSAQGNCYDNAKAEAFFSTLKTECFPPTQLFGSKALARREIFEYIEVYYNNRRLHSALGYQTPRQFEAGYSERRNNFFEGKVSATLFRMRNVVQESKRNKWRVARSQTAFLPTPAPQPRAIFSVLRLTTRLFFLPTNAPRNSQRRCAFSWQWRFLLTMGSPR